MGLRGIGTGPVDVLRKQVSNELFERDYTEIGDTIRGFKEGKR